MCICTLWHKFIAAELTHRFIFYFFGWGVLYTVDQILSVTTTPHSAAHFSKMLLLLQLLSHFLLSSATSSLVSLRPLTC